MNILTNQKYIEINCFIECLFREIFPRLHIQRGFILDFVRIREFPPLNLMTIRYVMPLACWGGVRHALTESGAKHDWKSLLVGEKSYMSWVYIPTYIFLFVINNYFENTLFRLCISVTCKRYYKSFTTQLYLFNFYQVIFTTWIHFSIRWNQPLTSYSWLHSEYSLSQVLKSSS